MSKFDKIFNFATSNRGLVLVFLPIIALLLYKVYKWFKKDKDPANVVITDEQTNEIFENNVPETDSDAPFLSQDWLLNYYKENQDKLKEYVRKMYNIIYSNSSSFGEFMFGNENDISGHYTKDDLIELNKMMMSTGGRDLVRMVNILFEKVFHFYPREYMLRMYNLDDYNEICSTLILDDYPL